MGVGVIVGVLVIVGVGVMVGVRVAVGVDVDVAVFVAVAVDVFVGVEVGIWVSVAVGVAVATNPNAGVQPTANTPTTRKPHKLTCFTFITRAYLPSRYPITSRTCPSARFPPGYVPPSLRLDLLLMHRMQGPGLSPARRV